MNYNRLKYICIFVKHVWLDIIRRIELIKFRMYYIETSKYSFSREIYNISSILRKN